MNSTDTPTGLLSVEQAAEELGVSRRAVLHRINAGTLPATKLGSGQTSAYVLTREAVDAAKHAA